ncbi:MAG: GNAT family N-acetyltransferase [Bacilli bacterium]|nr:GNAT family N-acetyltransferase [Bacilli bacterium]
MKNYEIITTSKNIDYIKVTEELVDDYLKMVNDYENVGKYISHKVKNYTREDELEWVRSQLEEDAILLTMIEKSTGEFIGNIEIMEIVDGIGEIGISITPIKQNKHYGREAIEAIIDYGFKNFNIKGYDLNVYATNERGIKCYESVGFVKVGSGKTDEDIHMVYQK